MYIVIELQKNANQLSHLETVHNTLEEAESKFHTILSYAAINEVPVHSAVILNEEGVPVKYQCYKH